MVNPYIGTVLNPPPGAHEGGIMYTGQAIRCGYPRSGSYVWICPCGKTLHGMSGAALNAGKKRCTTTCEGQRGKRLCNIHGSDNCYPEQAAEGQPT